jgi:hypothetical protein
MTHKQWHAKIRQSLAMVQRHPANALKSLDALASRVHSETANKVGDWHVEQTLQALSIVQSHLEQHRQSAETMLQIAERHVQQSAYYRRALVSAYATAAVELAAAGDRTGAVRTLRKADVIAAGLRPPDKLLREAHKVVDAMPRRRSGVSRRAPQG